jgi:hypothetical protein
MVPRLETDSFCVARMSTESSLSMMLGSEIKAAMNPWMNRPPPAGEPS